MGFISVKKEIMYIELKTGFQDNGPAWIGKVKYSRTGQTIYFNNKAFRNFNVCRGNYIDIETGDEYWISGVKKNGQDRHWAGCGKIMIDYKVVNEYLKLTEQTSLDKSKFVLVSSTNEYPIERTKEFENRKR